MVIVYASSVIVPLWLFQSADKHKSRTLLEALGVLGEPASIASIAAALRHRRLRDAAESALRSVIPNLRPIHYGTLPSRTVPNLCQALHTVDNNTSLLILQALVYIGDARAIRPVEQIVMNPASAEIGTAAIELLPILKQREVESKAPTQLLRASANEAAGQQELLRGVSGTTADNPDLLLRAAGAAKDEV